MTIPKDTPIAGAINGQINAPNTKIAGASSSNPRLKTRLPIRENRKKSKEGDAR
jgi:hypothetical protein